ncbi:VLRF1 family aeRF1-type release factor [Nannocystis bainbridge]|uniref:VLRF1 family aeRF1-type release factor n=1 Tax=Nannocystis bainbridge TaxID=2995303 RepID=A0ABT5E3H0_9BACT|nr:VLRF1 family aeRF1-type release factor [Nannocystis bainbridge]MDC0720416.1 VLRF1 family aeRF1-type release factor [Nannocystis bainbridge]
MLKITDVHRVLSQPGADKTLSIYAQVDPSLLENQGRTPGWRILVKNSLRDLKASSDDPALPELLARAEQFFATLRPECKAVAAFFTPTGEEVLRLQVPIVAPEVHFGRPAVASLLWLLDEYEPYVVALVDSEKVRFFVARLGRAGLGGTRYNEVREYDFPPKYLPATGRGEGGYTQGGSNRDAFEATIEDHARRFYRQVAEQCANLLEESGAKRIVLAGMDGAARAVEGLMHDTVRKAVIAIVPTPLHLTDQATWDHLMPHALEHERAYESALVDEVVDLAKAGGRGALGIATVLDCLKNKQVELLLVPWPLAEVDLRVRLPELAMAAGARIELVAGAAAERVAEEGGLAARLYYGIPAAAPTTPVKGAA